MKLVTKGPWCFALLLFVSVCFGSLFAQVEATCDPGEYAVAGGTQPPKAMCQSGGQGKSHLIIQESDGKPRFWGHHIMNNYGTWESEPIVALPAGRTGIAAFAGYWFSCVHLDDLTIKCFGNNDVGQVGDNTTVLEASSVGPERVLGGVLFEKGGVSIGKNFGCGVVDGSPDTIRCWGNPDAIDYRASPAVVGEHTFSSNVRHLYCGITDVFVILEDGRVLAWGAGSANDRLSRSPEPLDFTPDGDARTIKQIAAGIYLMEFADGSYSIWGSNAVQITATKATYQNMQRSSILFDAAPRSITMVAASFAANSVCFAYDTGEVGCVGSNTDIAGSWSSVRFLSAEFPADSNNLLVDLRKEEKYVLGVRVDGTWEGAGANDAFAISWRPPSPTPILRVSCEGVSVASCATCSTCAGGETVVVACNATHDTVCAGSGGGGGGGGTTAPVTTTPAADTTTTVLGTTSADTTTTVLGTTSAHTTTTVLETTSAPCSPGQYRVGGGCLECPAGSWCVDEVENACAAGTASPPGSDEATDCLCTTEGTFGPPGGPCEACTVCQGEEYETTACSVTEDRVCTALPSPCDIGSYGSVIEGCIACPPGYYCPGGADKVQCPAERANTNPRYGAESEKDCVFPACGNYVLEDGEECDSGPFNGDGCSDQCRFEDSSGTASGPEFVCANTPLFQTRCCPSLVNPVDEQYVCNCDGVTSNVSGIKINSDCTVTDIDECRTDNGGCAQNAVCVNYPATLTENRTHACICPPGMVGDGVSRCDIYVYKVTFKVAVQGVSLFDINEDDVKQRFIDNGVFPEGTVKEDIAFRITSYSGSFSNRRLLNTGVEIDASVETDSSLEMEETVNDIDTNAAISAVSDSLGGVHVEMTQQPAQEVLTIDQAFGTVGTILTGFRVDSVSYDNEKWEWIIRARFVNGAPNVITSMFMSKAGPPPYSQEVQNSFFIGQQPCMQTSSVCCLKEFRDSYTVGSFAANITESLGECGLDVRGQNTLDLFNPSGNSHLIANMLSDYPNSYVKVINENTVDIHVYRVDLRDSFSMRQDIVGGYEMDFLLGMAYYTLLPAPAISTVISQTRIQATYTDTVAFATTSEQDYTFMQYITVAVFDTKYISDIVNEHHPQAVRVGFVIPDEMLQNMRTGLVPLTSVRFAIAKGLPDQDHPTAWNNPCLSSTGTGLWDPIVGGEVNPLYSLYDRAEKQSCALQPEMCTNPLMADLDSRLVEFWFPIGDDLLNSTLRNSPEPYSIYIYFDISMVDSAGRSVQTKLFAQSPITALSLTMMCQSVEAANEVQDVMDVSLAVGMVGVEGEWSATMHTLDNILSTSTDLLDLNVNTTTPSIQNGLITIVLTGKDDSFQGPLAVNYHLEIDDMLSIHFLDDSIYDAVSQMFRDGTAWSLAKDDVTGYLQIVPENALVQACTSAQLPGDLSCAIRWDISGRVVWQEYAVHPLATGLNTHNLDADSAWLQRHLLGVSEYGNAMARNFTNIVRSRYNINDRYVKAWYVNPGYPWSAQAGSAAQSILSLSDKTIIVAVVVLDDGTGTRRRMLLQMLPGGKSSVQDIIDHPVKSAFPPIDNLAVDPLVQIADAHGLINRFGFFKATVEGKAVSGASPLQIRDTLQARLRAKMSEFAPTAANVWVAQYKSKATPAATGRRRALASEPTLAADILVLVEFTEYNNTVFETLFQNALMDGTIDPLASPGEQLVAITDLIATEIDTLKASNPEYSARFARVEKNWVNSIALGLGEATPYPTPYADSFGSESGVGVVGVSWLLLAGLVSYCLLVV